MTPSAPRRSGDPLRIVYFGTPAFAVPTLEALLRSRHAVCGVVTQPDRPRGRGHKVTDAPVKAVASAHGIPVIQPTRLGDGAVAASLRAWAPDLGVVAAYGRLIPDDILALPAFGMINVHASLLPRLRGAAPIHRAVMGGDRETGVTIMRVVTRLDAGPMLAWARRPIGPDDTSDLVERDLAALGACLLVEVVEQLAAGTAVEVEQDDAAATYAPKITKDEAPIDWTLAAATLHDRVRGLFPWPHAQTCLDGLRLKVHRTSVPAEGTDQPPGTVVEVGRDAIHVATGQGGRLALLEVQADGGRPMPVRSFLAGHAVQPGARFTSR